MDIRKVYFTWQDVEQMSRKIILSMRESNWSPDIIIGITRGGLIPAVMLSNNINVNMRSMNVSLRDYASKESMDIKRYVAENKRILVIDDINDTGATFQWIIDDWNTALGTDALPYDCIRFAALINNTPSKTKIDYYATSINKDKNPIWVCFPWESWDQNSF